MARKPASLWALSKSGGQALGSSAGFGSSTGDCESTIWALTPPNPEAVTPITCGSRCSASVSSSVTTCKLSPAKSIAGLGSFKCSEGASCWCRSCSTTLSKPAIPAAGSKWPRLLFTEPIERGAASPRLRPNASPRAWASIGSPTGVPVPCAST